LPCGGDGLTSRTGIAHDHDIVVGGEDGTQPLDNKVMVVYQQNSNRLIAATVMAIPTHGGGVPRSPTGRPDREVSCG
jgi:hypothetical protein